MLQKKFSALTPVSNVDLDSYRDAFDFAFDNDDIHNIAVSGAYGSGKSSVMASYESIHKEKKFIHITLAHFEEQLSHESKSNQDTNKTKLVNKLEGKILNQLLHQINPKNITYSRFQVKEDLSTINVVAKIALIVLYIISVLYIFCFDRWLALFDNFSEQETPFVVYLANPYARLIGGIILLILTGVWAYCVIRKYHGKRIFKKIDVNGIGVEVFENEKDSFFDKYLDEIIYLLEHSGAAAIVFEDMDRYEVTLIFEKLREISDLLWLRKDQRMKSNDLPYEPYNKMKTSAPKFIYLIRDDIFKNSERSKFFDFIIPVVPVADISNSSDQLLFALKSCNVDDKLEDRFLEDISLYLSDMRLITNVVNEYSIYKERLSYSKLTRNPNQQLALIIYKNIFPEDFIKLQKGQGYVYGLFKNKEEIISKRSAEIDTEIAKINSRIEELKAEHLRNIDELNAVFFPLNMEIIDINGKAISSNSSKVDRVDIVRKIIEYPDHVYYNNSSGYRYKLDPTDLISTMENNPVYQKRKWILKDKRLNKEKEYFQRLKSLNNEKTKLASMTLKELIAIGDDSFSWTYELPVYEQESYIEKIMGSKDFPLLKYLLRNGHIAENYAAYISIFYGNTLTVADKNFLLSISNREPLSYEYKLTEPVKVLRRLNLEDLSHREVQNFDLLEYLLKNQEINRVRKWFDWFDKWFDDGDRTAYDFALDFWRTGREAGPFLQTIVQHKQEWLKLWTVEGIVSGIDWQNLIVDVLCHCNEKQLKSINLGRWLTEAISADTTFLQIDDPAIEKLIYSLQILNVQFKDIIDRSQDDALVDAVYKKDLYEMNIQMLVKWMNKRWGTAVEDIYSKSYTYLIAKANEPLSIRVETNPNEYLQAILSGSDANFTDTEEAAIALINHKDILRNLKDLYIARLNTVIENLGNIEDADLWYGLLTQNCIAYSGENIASYYCKCCDEEGGIPQELIEFINCHEGDVLWPGDAFEEWTSDERDKLAGALIQCDQFSAEKYRSVLKTFGVSYPCFAYKGITAEHMDVLIDLKIVQMTTENIAFIRQAYDQDFISFVTRVDTEKFVEFVEAEDVTLKEAELKDLLISENLDINLKLRLLDTYDGTVGWNPAFPQAVTLRVINDHLEEDDIANLLHSFTQMTNVMQECVCKKAKETPDEFVEAISNEEFLPLELFAALLSVISNDDAYDLCQYLPEKGFQEVCTSNKRPCFKNTLVNRIILGSFVERRMISSYNTLENGTIRAYPKQG